MSTISGGGVAGKEKREKILGHHKHFIYSVLRVRDPLIPLKGNVGRKHMTI